MRAKGYDKCKVENRESCETVLFNSRLEKDDLELISLLLTQESARREFPSAGLEHAKELLERVQKWNRETIAAAELLLRLP